MKILVYEMGTYTQRDIVNTLDQMRIQNRSILYKLKNVYEDAYFTRCVENLLNHEKYDVVLSINYFPVLAEICRKFQIPYLSWSYDSPLNIEHIEETLGYETNYIFLFDKEEYLRYRVKGYDNVYHLPLAVNTQRLDSLICSRKEQEQYRADISMVGQLYNSPFAALLDPLADFEKGFLTAVMEMQMQLYGCNLLYAMINQDIVDKMNAAYQRLGQRTSCLTKDGLIVALSKQITHMERLLLLESLSEKCDVHLYGPSTDEKLARVKWHGSANYFNSMPKIFKCSKINLNITLKCIESGIPLRALDIMGCGGLLLSNYQPEIAENFEDGLEVVMYSSLEDCIEKCEYLLNNELERVEIAHKGYCKVKERYRYDDRLRTMFQIAGFL